MISYFFRNALANILVTVERKLIRRDHLLSWAFTFFGSENVKPVFSRKMKKLLKNEIISSKIEMSNISKCSSLEIGLTTTGPNWKLLKSFQTPYPTDDGSIVIGKIVIVQKFDKLSTNPKGIWRIFSWHFWGFWEWKRTSRGNEYLEFFESGRFFWKVMPSVFHSFLKQDLFEQEISKLNRELNIQKGIWRLFETWFLKFPPEDSLSVSSGHLRWISSSDKFSFEKLPSEASYFHRVSSKTG